MLSGPEIAAFESELVRSLISFIAGFLFRHNGPQPLANCRRLGLYLHAIIGLNGPRVDVLLQENKTGEEKVSFSLYDRKVGYVP